MMKDKQNQTKILAKLYRQKIQKNAGNSQTQAENYKLMKKIQDLLVYSWGYSNTWQ